MNIVHSFGISFSNTEDRHLGFSEIVRLNNREAIVAKLMFLEPIFMEVGTLGCPSHPLPRDTFVAPLHENIEAR